MGSLENSGQSSGEIGDGMTFREAKRAIAGDPRSEWWSGADVIYGTYTKSKYHWPTGYAGKPAISVNLNGGRSGTKTFMGLDGVTALRSLRDDITSAIEWLEGQNL